VLTSVCAAPQREARIHSRLGRSQVQLVKLSSAQAVKDGTQGVQRLPAIKQQSRMQVMSTNTAVDTSHLGSTLRSLCR
jgi:hypothetical protein